MARHNKTAAPVPSVAGETVNACALTAMVKQVIANNRAASGWRKLKREVWVAPG